MKKSTLTVIGIIALALIVVLIMYMKPDSTVVDSVSPQDKANNTIINVPDNTQEAPSESIDQTNAPVTNNTQVGEEEIDFNQEVYGNSLPQGEVTVNEEGVMVPDSDNFLSDTASDPNIQPIDPVDDPANQIYKPPSEEETQ